MRGIGPEQVIPVPSRMVRPLDGPMSTSMTGAVGSDTQEALSTGIRDVHGISPGYVAVKSSLLG